LFLKNRRLSSRPASPNESCRWCRAGSGDNPAACWWCQRNDIPGKLPEMSMSDNGVYL
jgi:hypothetical protein